ncbi:ubiquitin-like domain-containing protein [Streptomyces sp. NPDC091268]|uniref:ubiquitin-like domain-containing protein n=1 Tax=Streptomyces sp. NPDC091268 TaxID=3365979 RepID=UPI0037F66448
MSESPFTGVYGDEAGPVAWPGPPTGPGPDPDYPDDPHHADYPDLLRPDPDPDPGADPPAGPRPEPEPGVPSPRGGSGRRARGRAAPQAAPEPRPATGRRRRPEAGPPPGGAAPTLTAPAAPAPAGPGTGRRRGAPLPGDDALTAPGPTPAGPARRGTGRRRAGAPPAGAPAGSWRRIVPQALVVAFLAGGTSAFVAADKTVRLTVDGVPQTLHTFADDVDELLAAEGLDVGLHDLVAPAPGEDLDDGDRVVVHHGRPLRLTLDGQQRQVWTTARTVDGALRQFGIRAEGAYLSAPRSAPVPRTGLTLAVRTERSITFMADGRETTLRTNAATVQEALGQAGITLRGQDSTSVPAGAFPRDGQTITVLRITGTREVREEHIPYETEKVKDATLFVGTEVVERAGRPGARRVTYSLRTVNGVRQKPRRIAEETVREPVAQLVKVGTKPLPTSVAGADGLDWGALARCESGGRPGATDPSGTYGGLYQFDVRTWQALGGSGRPQDAPGQEQTYRAKKLYVQRGASPWPHCGRRLYR